VFALNLKQDLAVGILLVLYFHFFTCLSCTQRLHFRGDRGATRKYRIWGATKHTEGFGCYKHRNNVPV